MFDDLKQDDNQAAPAPAVSAPKASIPSPEPSAQPVAPAPQPAKIDDMFDDVDPVAANHGPVDPAKPSAIQSGKIKAVSQTSVPSPEPSAQPVAPAPQLMQEASQVPNIPPSDSMVLAGDGTSGPMKKIIIAVLVILLLAIAGGAIYYFFLKDKGTEVIVDENVNIEIPLNENVNEEKLIIDDEPLINEDDLDDDYDGLSNGLEKIYGTNPMEADSDNDGVFDQDEIEVYHTDPLVADTDNDGLGDYEEIIIYKTDPNDPDTDGDGYQDGAEVNNGYNPLGSGKLSDDEGDDGLLNGNENL